MLQSGTSQIADIQRAKFDYQIAQVRAMQEQFSGEMGLALREKETNKSAREEQYSRAIQAMLQLKLADLEIKRGIIQSYPQVAMDMMRLLNTEDTQSTDWKLQMMNIGQNSMTEIHNMKQAYERQMASIFADLFEKEFNGALTDATVVKSARDQFIQFGVDQMMRGMYQEVDSSQRYAAIAADQMRFGITSQREYEKDLVEAKTGYADWDLSHALQGMTILSNPMTGASYVPGRPSRGQAVGQGVLTGMGAGAAAGSVLGVPGILAGGIIGGLGGLFS
jgi:hypothetical protein